MIECRVVNIGRYSRFSPIGAQKIARSRMNLSMDEACLVNGPLNFIDGGERIL